MAKDSGHVRRGGRWIEAGSQFRDRGRLLRAIFSRSWYILVPFIGIMCANDAKVRPFVEEVKSEKNIDRKAILDQIDDVRADVSQVNSEAVIISAELDTLHLPQVAFYSATLDSLLSIRRIYDAELPVTEAKIDSLRFLQEELQAEIDRLSAEFQRKTVSLDSLGQWQAALDDSIVGLDEYIVSETDHLYRLRHPREFRGKEALITGEGEYPRRDERLPRERGK